MTGTPSMKYLRLAILGGALTFVFALTCAAGIARAQEDEEEDHVLNTDKRVLNSILGAVGLASPASGNIEYRERSPLVVPSRRDLPPPEPSATVKNPAWPVDPEVKMRKEMTAARKSGRTVDVDPSKPLSGTGMLDAKGTPREYSAGYDKMKDEPDLFTRMFKGGNFWSGPKDDVATFSGEPPRGNLTEPPPGYQTPSPAAPYGVSKRPNEYKKPEPKI